MPKRETTTRPSNNNGDSPARRRQRVTRAVPTLKRQNAQVEKDSNSDEDYKPPHGRKTGPKPKPKTSHIRNRSAGYHRITTLDTPSPKKKSTNQEDINNQIASEEPEIFVAAKDRKKQISKDFMQYRASVSRQPTLEQKMSSWFEGMEKGPPEAPAEDNNVEDETVEDQGGEFAEGDGNEDMDVYDGSENREGGGRGKGRG